MSQVDLQKKLERIATIPSFIQPIVLAALLADLFKQENVDLTVVGGAAVQFYTQGDYSTYDLDTILQGDTKEIVESIMTRLGFKRTTNYRHFEHPFFGFTVEFPASPISVGSRVISKINNIETEEGLVRVIKLEDIIMDRIVATVEWRDKPSLDQAKLLYLKNKKQIDLDYLTDFAKKEGYWKTLQEVLKYKPQKS